MQDNFRQRNEDMRRRIDAIQKTRYVNIYGVRFEVINRRRSQVTLKGVELVSEVEARQAVEEVKEEIERAAGATVDNG